MRDTRPNLALALALVAAGLLGACATPAPAPILTQFGGNDGALQFLITPDDADVYVDADYMGKAREFTGDRTLVLERGLHAVEVRRDGYLTLFRQVQTTQGLLEVLVYTLAPDGEGPYRSGPKPKPRR